MLQQLFVDVCILITVIFITSQIFSNTGISVHSPLRLRILLGILGGISSSILIYFNISVTSKVMFDFRDICIMLTAIFGGIISSLITGMMTSAFLLIYHGIGQASVISAIGILVVSLGCGIISGVIADIKMRSRVLLLFSLLIRSVICCIISVDKKSAILVILASWVSTIIIATGVYYFVRYLAETHKMLKSLKLESTHDFLTGLTNARQFEKKYNAALQDILEAGMSLSLFIIDIDHFKRVNDTYGHAAGDEVLKGMGVALRTAGVGHYLLSRIGGEEFAIVYRELEMDEVKRIAEKIRRAVEAQPFTIAGGKKVRITISVGVAVYPDTVKDILNLRSIADKKLYEAKRLGRNRVCF